MIQQCPELHRICRSQCLSASHAGGWGGLHDPAACCLSTAGLAKMLRPVQYSTVQVGRLRNSGPPAPNSEPSETEPRSPTPLLTCCCAACPPFIHQPPRTQVTDSCPPNPSRRVTPPLPRTPWPMPRRSWARPRYLASAWATKSWARPLAARRSSSSLGTTGATTPSGMCPQVGGWLAGGDGSGGVGNYPLLSVPPAVPESWRWFERPVSPQSEHPSLPL